MKIVVTGAGGFVGKRLVSVLALQGHDVWALVRKSPQEKDKHFFQSDHVNFLKVDLENFNTKSFPKKADALITLAQSSNFRDFPEKANEIFTINTSSNIQLLDWARTAEVTSIIHASSGGVYGEKANSTFNERDLLAVDTPLGFYLGSKLCAEIVLQNYRHFFESTIILRPFFIYGSKQREDMLIARLINSIKTEKPITLSGQDGFRFNPIHVDDVVRSAVLSLKLKGTHIINVGGPDNLSLREVANIIGERLNKKPIFQYLDEKPNDYVGESEYATQKLNLNPMSFRQGISMTIE